MNKTLIAMLVCAIAVFRLQKVPPRGNRFVRPFRLQPIRHHGGQA